MARLMPEFPGLVELMKERATLCSGVSFMSGETMQLLGQMVFNEEIMSDLGSDFYLVSYSDLVSHLYNLCRGSGVQIKHNFVVKEVVTSADESPAVVSDSGVRLTADIVVGADGKNSIVRQVISSEEPESEDEDSFEIPGFRSSTPTPEMHEIGSAALTIPIAAMESDPDLKSLITNDRFNLWTGNGHAFSGSTCGREMYNLGLTYSFPPKPDDIDADWYDHQPLSTMEKQLSSYHPTLQKLAKLASGCHWSIQISPNLPRYTNQTDQVVVIGDAAHCVPLNSSHNTSLAFEDAVTLGRIFSRVTSKEDIPLFLNGFNEIKRPRTRQTELAEYGGVPTQGSSGSCLGMTLHLDGADDDTLAQAWGSYVGAFNYDANDAVDEWWMNWARPMHSNGWH
ncbi:hypothetical protein VNI00_006577 [Paramarasmius palmivorus]|uniref:FAD-binding domain-containing protein n=1 Tax=Paramarasmius palmivorus TaxID=297713 RepID=A0AAW0D4F1_9AGAR